MLYELHVRDMALIKEARLEFGEGLHVLTGETGAGKSLLLGSVGLALGARVGADIIRRGADSALSSLSFGVTNQTAAALEELGLAPDEDGNLILSRIISEKRGSCRINGESVPLSKLREAAGLLIDIHGQHEHQSLLKKSNHIKLLDAYAQEELSDVLPRLKKSCLEYRRAVKELAEQDSDPQSRLRELSLIEYELSEIRGAALKEGEEEELEAKHRILANSREIAQALSAAGELIGSDRAVSEGLSTAIREVTSAIAYDDGLGEVLDPLLAAEENLSAAALSLRNYIEHMEFNDEELYNTEKRLDLIRTLEQKYGSSVAEINEYADRREERLKELNDFDSFLEGLRERVSRSREELDSLCAKAGAIRRAAAAGLEAAVCDELKELNFLDARFEIAIRSLDDYTSEGLDEVEFLISMNPGEPLRALSQIASGGELSRIMLALRTVSAVKDGIDTLIFDEIDAGISGVTAGMVAKKLSDLARGRQVICITHLPQIAAYADRHYLIEKSAQGDVTTTSIVPTDEETFMGELVRLLGGTKSAPAAAAELREQAIAHKSTP